MFPTPSSHSHGNWAAFLVDNAFTATSSARLYGPLQMSGGPVYPLASNAAMTAVHDSLLNVYGKPAHAVSPSWPQDTVVFIFMLSKSACHAGMSVPPVKMPSKYDVIGKKESRTSAQIEALPPLKYDQG